MQVDKETLIKHHYWILLGIDIPLLLIVLMIIAFSVSGRVDGERKKVEDAKKTLDGIQNPKNQAFLTYYEDRSKRVGGKQNEVWEKAWRAQDGMMTWPEPQKKFESLYFGDAIDSRDRGDYADKKEGYISQIHDILYMPRPFNDLNPPEWIVQYKGGPGNILRFVTTAEGGWTKSPPELDEVWLAQEDIWVQRELLRIVRDCNDTFAACREVGEEDATKPKEEPKKQAEPAKEESKKQAEPAKEEPKKQAEPAKDGAAEPAADEKAKPAEPAKQAAPEKPKPPSDPRHKKFANAYWELDLKLVKNDSNKSVIRGSIKNRTKVRRPLGMFFKVQVQEGSTQRAAFLADGEPLAGGETVTFKDSEPIDNLNPQGLFAVEQVLNWRTAPVKRIDLLAMGYNSHRLSSRMLVPPRFIKKIQDDAAAEQAASGGGGGGAAGASPSPMASGDAAGAGGPAGAMMQMAGGQQAGMTPNGLSRNRYIDVTDQVRRMPVGMVVVVDQAHVEDFLSAFANARLRIQTTQVHWQHLRENIKPSSEQSAPSTGPGSGVRPSGPMVGGGVRPGGGEPDDDTRSGAGIRPGGPGGKFGAGRFGPPGYPGVSMPGMMPGRMPGTYMPSMPGMPSGGYPGMGGTSEDQEEDLNLVELAVYGVASLYERYPPKKEQAAPDATTPGTTSTPSAGN
jgi:hypothetical protein